MEIEVGNYYMEIFCALLTVVLIAMTLLQKEEGLETAEASKIGFQKVLAAHSFTWIGVQTMFIYMFQYLQQVFPTEDETSVGQILDVSFLLLNGIAAFLPAFVLEPLTRRIGQVRTHMLCIALMAAGYAGLWILASSQISVYALMIVVGVG